jgi:hypothetical protein
MNCIRCGGCCKSIPCYFAQIYYNLTKKNKGKCPELVREQNGKYICQRMLWDTTLKREMLGTGCHYPEFREGLQRLNTGR